jgi:hypothetical protein
MTTAVTSTNIVPSLLILSTLMMEVLLSSETSVLSIVTQCHISYDSSFQVKTSWSEWEQSNQVWLLNLRNAVIEYRLFPKVTINVQVFHSWLSETEMR